MGEPGIPGGSGVGLGSAGAGLAILAGWVKVRAPVGRRDA